jgi:hypothetical protein
MPRVHIEGADTMQLRCWHLSWLVLLAVLSASGTPASSDQRNGFSAAEIANAATVEGETVGGTIMDVRSVVPGLGEPRGLAFEILKAKQWRVVFVKSEGGRFRLDWVSEPLGSTFEEVALNAGLSVVSIDGKSRIVLRGCAEHMCPLVFGIAVFRLDDGKPFVVKVTRLGKERNVEYSPYLSQPEYKPFKDWLDGQIDENAQPDYR